LLAYPAGKPTRDIGCKRILDLSRHRETVIASAAWESTNDGIGPP